MLLQDELLLKNTLLFWNQLTTTEQDLMTRHMQLVHYPNGTQLHRGNLDCHGLLVIKSGALRVFMLSNQGKEVTLYRLFDQDVCILSASCALSQVTFDIHIDIEADSELFLLPTSIFSQLISQNIYVENFSYKVITNRFSDVMWAMEQILFMRFDQRLALFLLEESMHRQSTCISLTHDQVARYIGSAREVVSRMLKYFSQEGFIDLHRGQIILTNPSALQQLSTLS